MDNQDWLKDPLADIQQLSYKPRKLKNRNDEQSKRWQSFHFSTRLKLEAADHFCRQVLGAASLPDNLGLPLLAHRQLKWYLDAFFFELMSAYDTLLHELNIIYAYDLGLKAEEVKWGEIKDRLPGKLSEYMDTEWHEQWFDKVRRCRNMATHQSYLWTGEVKALSEDAPWEDITHDIYIYYPDETGALQHEKISLCSTLFQRMLQHIYRVWQEMGQDFV